MTASTNVELRSKRYKTEDIPPAMWFVVVAVVYVLFTKVGLYFVVKPEGLSIFWPVSGIALALLIANPRGVNVAIVAIFLANTAGNYLFGGNSLAMSIGFAMVNTIESFACFFFIKKFFSEKITFGKQSIVIGFIIISFFVTAATGVVGAIMLHVIHDSALFNSWYIWLVSDALGIIMEWYPGWKRIAGQFSRRHLQKIRKPF